MKKILPICTVLTLFAALAVPLQLNAQGKPDRPHSPHHYQLLDLGSTFGGPQSYFVPGSGNEFSGSSVLNSGGAAVGFADTSATDPFPDICFWDCNVVHAFLATSGGSLTDLGALPGGGSSAPIWISENGLVAGVSENGKTDPLYPGLPQLHAVLWNHGTIIDLGTLPGGGYQSEANAMNSSGQVVGSALNAIPDNNSMQPATFWLWGGILPPYQYQTRAFVWDKQRGMQDLGTLPGGTDAQAILINERGQVVGYSYTASTQSGVCFPLVTSSFLWERGKGMVDLGGFGGTCTLATAVNNEGAVVGESYRAGDQSAPAFLWENGSIHELAGSFGGDFSGAFAINDPGEAAGFGYLSGNSTFHAALWKDVKSITDLGVIGSDSCSYAAAINVGGQVVGSSSPTCDFDEARAFLWEDGTLFDLNSLIPPASALYLKLTYAINNRGEIAGTGVDASGNDHAFLVIPCDENHPGVEGCDYNFLDAAEAAREIPAPVLHEPTFVAAKVGAGALIGSLKVKTIMSLLTSTTTNGLPAITHFTPADGPVGASVTIKGRALMPTTNVTFGGEVATFVVNSNSQVTATVPSGAVTGKIAITTPAGTAVSSRTFKVTGSSVLTGYCLQPGLACSANYFPSECPAGAKPIDPGTAQCGFPIDRADVDLGRSCNSGSGFCSRTGSERASHWTLAGQ